MQVTVQLTGHLLEFFPHLRAPMALEVEPGATVADALACAGVPPTLPAAVYVGDVRADESHALAEGDALLVLSPIAGG